MFRLVQLICLSLAWVTCCIPSVYAKSTDSTSIRISVEHKKRMMLRGDLLDNETKQFQITNVKENNKISLGKLGLNSNIKATQNSRCQIGFETKNDFRLKQLNEPNNYLARYKIAYNGKIVDSTTTLEVACNTGERNLSLESFDLLSSANKNGVYQDTITILIIVP